MSSNKDKKEKCPYNDGCACAPRTRDCDRCGWKPKEEKNYGKE